MNRPGEDTLIRYFRGQCPPDEAEAVRLYLAMNTDGDYIEMCMQEAWGDLQQAPGINMSTAQLDERWQQLAALRSANVHRISKPVKYKALLRYAAVFALLLTGALTVSILNSRRADRGAVAVSYQAFSAPKGQARLLKLTDGSLVTLFPGSEIQVANDFNRQERTVQLKGRAFFEVAPDAERPFYVRTAHLTTKVLGTAFDVNAGRQDVTSKITLLSGRVSVSYATKEIATLAPGQQVVFDSATHKWQVNHVNARDAMAWTSGEFNYENATLQQVFRDIENWYDVSIQVSHSSITHKEITTNFKGLQLEQVLKMITKASGLRYTINGKQVLVSTSRQ